MRRSIAKSSRSIATSAVWLVALLVTPTNKVVNAAPASPLPQVYRQPDGSSTPELYLNGDEHYAWLSDPKGYTVIQDEQGWYVYAQKTSDGNLISAGTRVGHVNPKKMGLAPQLLHDHAFAEQVDADMLLQDDDPLGVHHHGRRSHHRSLGVRPEVSLCTHVGTALNPCYLKQLALLVRFHDHQDRELPSPEEIDILFNHNGPTGTGTASTGSISDLYRANSFDTFVMDTHVTPWMDISITEAYASDGQQGFNKAPTREAWAAAMVKYAGMVSDGLGQFDADGDGYFDGLAIVHSGVAAESNGPDCETGSTFNNRIWSHAVPKSWEFDFLKGTSVDIKVGRFYVFSGVLGTCPPGGAFTAWDSGRIAVGVHEGGHFLGLPDLYGIPGQSNGIGNWGFMGTLFVAGYA
jgi:M6 family metalloprotease-like protein